MSLTSETMGFDVTVSLDIGFVLLGSKTNSVTANSIHSQVQGSPEFVRQIGFQNCNIGVLRKDSNIMLEFIENKKVRIEKLLSD